MKSKLAELHQRHSTRLITSFEAEKALNKELNAANFEIEKLKSNLKMADEDNMKMRKQNVELKVESDEMKRRLKSITDKTAATKSPKKNAFDSEIIEDPTMTDTSTKGVADSEEAVENVKDQIATDKTTLGDPKKAFCVETESIIIDKEANEINDMNQIFEGLKNATAYLDENEIPFDKSTSYVAKLRSTLSFLTLEYQKIHKKLEESEASFVKVNSEKQNLETEIAMLQKKLTNSKTEFNELRSAYLRTPQIENFQNVNRENAALKAKIQEERNATTLKIAQLVQQNSNHLEEKKQWIKVLDASIIREKRIEGFQNEIAKLNHELKYYHEAFSSSSSSTDEVSLFPLIYLIYKI
uniref:Uncharacterized protein n=1 Tax=Panagrolaimus superbus TaxID=310955 RepID=A0A914XV95_9BILA